jgi:hypothetical protein
MTLGQTNQDQSISMNDDNNIQMTSKYLHDDEEENNYKNPSNRHDNSNKTNMDNDYVNKTSSSNSNVFSRLMHSEPHVENNQINDCCFTILFFIPLLLLPAPLHFYIIIEI